MSPESNLGHVGGKQVQWQPVTEREYQLRVWTNQLIFFLICLYGIIFSFREESVKRYAGKSDPIDVMGHIRRDKDKFRAKR